MNPIRVIFGPEKNNFGTLLSAEDPKGQWIFDPSHKINIEDFYEDDNKSIHPTDRG